MGSSPEALGHIRVPRGRPGARETRCARSRGTGTPGELAELLSPRLPTRPVTGRDVTDRLRPAAARPSSHLRRKKSMKGFTKIIRGTHRETRRSAAVTPFGAGQNACSVQVPGTLQSWKRPIGCGRRRKMGHLVLWSFVVGLTPLTLGLGWKLFSGVG